ncbi:MAG: DUF3228 family protein [Cyanobacteria bacterium SZAS LIN-3]|nr:DUF3228 family protein [Cyanobacteria bacterium SZAS LIN-3]MBS2006056.1 DUF3228 family protein [Cyanobacteria bacterium SZAS TMP-1]
MSNVKANVVELNHFVKRQTPESRFSHYEPPSGRDEDRWPALLQLIEQHFGNEALLSSTHPERKVLKLSLPAEACKGFFSGVLLCDENTVFKTVFAVRDRAVEGELPTIRSVAVGGGRKAEAVRVDIILYNASILTEEELTYTADDGTTIRQTGEWQVISINARDTEEEEPPTPEAMARNMAALLGLPGGVGGTPRSYTAEQFMQSILYWNHRTMRGQ